MSTLLPPAEHLLLGCLSWVCSATSGAEMSLVYHQYCGSETLSMAFTAPVPHLPCLCKEIAAAIACVNLPAKLANAAVSRLVLPAHPVSAVTKAVTAPPVPKSPSLFPQLRSWTLEQQLLIIPWILHWLDCQQQPFLWPLRILQPNQPLILLRPWLHPYLLEICLVPPWWMPIGNHVHANPGSHLSVRWHLWQPGVAVLSEPSDNLPLPAVQSTKRLCQ